MTKFYTIFIIDTLKTKQSNNDARQSKILPVESFQMIIIKVPKTMKVKICNQQFELLPLIFTSVTIILLILCGNWQLRRLEEKEYFIATIEDNIVAPAKILSEFRNTPPIYSKATISGHFIPHKNLYLYGRRTASPEKDGYYLISAFASDNGQTYMISRGWLPASIKSHLIINESIITETIEGMVLPGEKKNFVIPDNDQKNNIWFTLDLDMAANTMGSTVNDFYLMQINSDALPNGVAPLNTNNLSKVRNDHLEYAITWYSLAGCLFVIFMVYSRKRKA